MLPLRRIAPLLAVALTVAAGVAVSAPALNQLENGGFEEFSEAGNPAEWTVLSGNANPTSDAAEGSQAVVLTFDATVTLSGIAQDVDLDRRDAVAPNADYDLAFDAKLETATGNTPATANATILWRDALGNTAEVDTVTIDQSDTYTAYDETRQAPANATAAQVQFALERPSTSSAANALLKVDDAAFGPSSP